MEKYEISILLITICITGVAFNIKISDLTIFKTFKVKSLNVKFRSDFIFKSFRKFFKRIKKRTKKVLTSIIKQNRT